MSQPVDIYVLGAGINIPAHFTFETLNILKSCNILYTVIRKEKEAWLPKSIDIEVCSYWNMYKSGKLRGENYQKAIDLVLNAVEKHAPVAYLTPGNPVVYDSVSHGIIREGKARGYNVQVCAGISSIDTLLVDLRQDITSGIQIYDSSAVITHEIKLVPSVASILFQVDVFGSHYALHGKQVGNDFLAPLKDYLLQFYPKHHPVTFVRSQESFDTRTQISTFLIEDLGNIDNQAQIGTSLFIPATEELELKNKSFLKQMMTAPTT